MAGLSRGTESTPAESNAVVKRRGLLRLGTLATAFTGVSAISALAANDASAATGDTAPPTTYVPTTEKGVASGVATLDIQAKIPSTQLPDLSAIYAAKREFYPEHYGADNTGTADSRKAIQAAVDAARDAGGGTVILDGTYRVDASICPRNNVTIQGHGWGRSILKPPATWAGGSVLEVGGTVAAPIENFTVRDIKIDLSLVPATVQAKGLFVTYMRNLRFENNWVLNSTATGIGADFLDKSVIRGNRVEGCGRYAESKEESRPGCSGIGIGTGAWATEATLVEGNFVINAVRYGIFVEYQRGISSEFTRHIKIINNHIQSAHWGIGSDGCGWTNITGNSVEGCDLDGIVLTVGNAGALSFGDLIAHNRVTANGRYGILLDATTDGVTPPRRGHWRILDNDIWGNASVGIKLLSSPAIPHVKINGNSIFENGNIGVDLSGSLYESEIVGNRIVDNAGAGIRMLAAAAGLKITANRIGDTRTSGKTQTTAIDVPNAAIITMTDIEDNDLRGNSYQSLAVVGTWAATDSVRRNKGYGPDDVEAVTVTASPQLYTLGARPEKFWVIGGTWTNIQINGQTILTGPGSFDAEPNDVVTFRYTSAPTAIKRRRL